MSSQKDYTKKYSGIIGLTLTDLESNFTRALRLPTDVVIDDNPDLEDINGTDSLGRETIIDVDVRGFKPVLTLTYSGANTALTALQRGRKLQSGLFDLTIPKEMQVVKGTYAAAPVGKIGYGVVVDAETLGGTTDENGQFVPLTQQDFADFDPTDTLSFAIGANFARKFSDDLVEGRKFVQLAIPQSIQATTISEEALGPQKIDVLVRNSNDTLTYLKAYSAIIRPEGSGFRPKADTFEIRFNLSGLGQCEPYSVFDSAEKLYCEK